MSLPLNIGMYRKKGTSREELTGGVSAEKGSLVYEQHRADAEEVEKRQKAGMDVYRQTMQEQADKRKVDTRAEISAAYKASPKNPVNAGKTGNVSLNDYGSGGAYGTMGEMVKPVVTPQTGVQLGDYQPIYDRQAEAMDTAADNAKAASDAYYKAAEDAYRTTMEDTARRLENERAEGRRAASADLERLSRYLTLKDAYGGTTGSGVSETNRVAMGSAALNRMYAADAAASEGQAQARSLYGSQMGQLNAERAAAEAQRITTQETGKADLWAGYAAQNLSDARDNGMQTEADAESMLADMYAGMVGDDMKISADDYEAMKAEAEKLRGNLTSFQQARLDSLLTAYGTKVRSAEEEQWNLYRTKASVGRQAVSAEEAKAGDTIKVKMGGKSYKLAVGDVTDDETIERQAMRMSDGTVFAVGSGIYVKSSGQVFTVKAGEKDYADVWKNFG